MEIIDRRSRPTALAANKSGARRRHDGTSSTVGETTWPSVLLRARAFARDRRQRSDGDAATAIVSGDRIKVTAHFSLSDMG